MAASLQLLAEFVTSLLLRVQEFFTEMEKQAAEAAKQASKKR
jgi:hypothetical protein